MDDPDRDEMLRRAVSLREADRTELARELLLTLRERFPDDVEVAYQTAWAHDKLGLEAEAVPHYERSLATDGLSAADRLGAFTGLGSTYRVLGQYQAALATLRRGLEEFPGDGGLTTFMAMALYNIGEARESVSLLLRLLAATSSDEQVQRYRRAIELYAGDLDATV
jgi:tetratricopeptide (TPR) repeat protein